MNRNYKHKVKDFFRREGFYLILFLCVCLVATVTTISYKKEKNAEVQKELSNENTQEITLNTEDSNVKTNEMQNAERVENNPEQDKYNVNTSEEAKKEVPVTNAVKTVKFSKPVEGKLLRGYTYPKPVKTDENSQRTIRGIDIEASVGTQVKAAEEGIVELAENNGVEDGVAIVISHANGIKTKYSNLDSNLLVKVGDKVTKGKAIGTIGTTAKIYSKDIYGEHLNIQILNANNEQEDPLKYFEY